MLSGCWLTKKKPLFVCLSLAGVISAQAGEVSPDMTHTVIPSDHITAIRNHYCDPAVSARQIADYNGILNPNLIQPGDVIRIKPSWLKSTPQPINLLVFSGDVKIQKHNKKASETLTQKHVLSEGDKLITGANSLVKLRFADDSVVNLQPNAVMQIVFSRKPYHSDKMQIEVDMQQGRTEVLANPEHKADRQFKVKTPSAVAVVRGTKFRVGSEAGKTIEETLDGSVDFAVAANKVQVEKGFGSLAEAGKAPLPPVALPPVPDAAALQSRFEFAPVTFDLAKQEKVAAINVQLSQAEDFSSLISTQRLSVTSGASSQLALGAITDGDYYLKLRSESDQGLQSEDVIHAFTVDVFPLPPEPVLGNSSISPSAGWALQWSRMQGIDGYVLQVSDAEGFSNVMFEKPLFYNSFYLTPFLAKTAKYWRVGIRTNENKIKYSKPIELTKLD